jgi:1-acyl-sn-glycerol-3-phosphate acyltransferase/DNA-directed RNA polymerase subunit RPC12/RpoP
MKRPNIFLFIILGFLVKIYAFIKGQRITKKVKIKGPAIVLSNHTSFYDFIYTTAAIYPNRVSYLAANKMFYEPVTGFFLRLARAIPKSLMQADPVASIKAFRILKKNGILSIFPEGQISPTGTLLKPAFSIAKFLKKANVDVYIVKHKGAYFVNPPWTKKTFKGIIETEKFLLLTKEEIQNLTTDQIYDLVYQKLYVSSSEFSKASQYSYKINDIANLENVIYQCPKCSHEGIHAKYDYLECPICFNRLVYDQKGLLNNLGVDELFKIQAEKVKFEIDSNIDYTLSADTNLMSFRNNKLVHVGRGKLTLSRFQYLYEGMIDNEKANITFNVSSTPTLPSDIGRNIQIYEGYQIYQFEMDIKWLPTKFVHAGEYLHELYNHQQK